MSYFRQALIPVFLLGLAACDQPAPATGPGPQAAIPGTNGPVVTDRPLARDEIRTSAGIRVLPAEKRLAVLAGSASAGLALYQAGELDAAAPHLERLLGPETATEREGFDRFGFDPASLDTVRQAVEGGVPPEDAMETIDAAQAAIFSGLEGSGMDSLDLVLFLLEVCGEEYGAGVMDAAIQRPLAYQVAYGHAVNARQVARGMEDTGDLVLELEILVRMWPDNGPVTADAVAPVAAMGTQIARARLAASVL